MRGHQRDRLEPCPSSTQPIPGVLIDHRRVREFHVAMPKCRLHDEKPLWVKWNLTMPRWMVLRARNLITCPLL